ncbi:hypothetical protein [Streptacidiphilus anmyonensis]|uniref:hypothetical protein n=1 Tax=Streptacidiphilus anmyonensis TaxID=405782 RepID=UPI0005AAC84E|nr:hypothetical protein [Streptacidiphilus anmyonensis]
MFGRPRRFADRETRELMERCRRTVDALALPSPFDVVDFVATLERRRGRPIRLLPMAARPNVPCGLLASTDDADYISYSADTTALHQQHILLHEVAHLICGHHQSSATRESTAQLLFPNLPPALVHRVLGRSAYSEPQEREAELIATLIRCRAALEDERRSLAEPGDTRLGSLLAPPRVRSRRD